MSQTTGAAFVRWVPTAADRHAIAAAVLAAWHRIAGEETACHLPVVEWSNPGVYVAHRWLGGATWRPERTDTPPPAERQCRPCAPWPALAREPLQPGHYPVHYGLDGDGRPYAEPCHHGNDDVLQRRLVHAIRADRARRLQAVAS